MTDQKRLNDSVKEGADSIFVLKYRLIGVVQFTVLELTRLTETWIDDFPGSKQLSMSFDGTVRLRTYMGFRSSLRGERLVSITTSVNRQQ